MAKRILDLGHAPPDEIVAMTDALEAAGIPHYITQPGLFGLAAGGLWIVHDSDAARARDILDRAQADYLAARRDAGDTPGGRRGLTLPAPGAVFAVALLAGFLYLLWDALRTGM